ncbi:MAG TPA: serine hydrolase domain-containing protein [Gemmatimonadales bacterium]|nr:serine hydrolase domain-containing protein [Gemmatimonadales bacterium]
MLRMAPSLQRIIAAALVAVPSTARSQVLAPAERAKIDSAVAEILRNTGAPSASIAVVRGGAIVYEHAYGNARVDPVVPATTAMRYSIGSVTKQFTATAILLLAEAGELSLDDKVAKWFPALTRADEISIRQLLSMTAGYQDFWPQDYVFTDMQHAITARAIMGRWAGKPLDFDPGTRWQYSNTNYVIAAAIAEQVAGIRLMDFMRQRIFMPLDMKSVADVDAGPLSPQDAGPYLRHAIGPLRLAPKEGAGWLFGAGHLGMTAHDLALWDISVINRSLLRSESYQAQQTDMLLGNGLSTRYGLGVNVGQAFGTRRLSHGGAVSGYTTSNDIYPDQKAAIVVFTNIYPGAAGAPGQIAGRIAEILFAQVDSASRAARELARRIYDGLAKAELDTTLFTDNAKAYFTREVIADYAASLGPLGAPTEFASTGESLRGGMTIRSYRIRAGRLVLSLTTMTLPDGKIEQYLIERSG